MAKRTCWEKVVSEEFTREGITRRGNLWLSNTLTWATNVNSLPFLYYVEKSASAIGDIDREAKILKMLNHKNIIKLYQAFVVKHELLLIMEYADGGELIEYVEEK